MVRFSIRTAVLAAILAAWSADPAQGQVRYGHSPGRQAAAGRPLYRVRAAQYEAGSPYGGSQPGQPRRLIIDGTPTGPQSVLPGTDPGSIPQGDFAQFDGGIQSAAFYPPPAQGYPYLNAPLYSSPQQNIPYQVGTTIVTNQALAPHEMLHPHEYEALYPPFYYKVRGHWWVWPWGVESHDRWELQGTKVEIEYKSHISPFAGFVPPVLR